jgi:uncharacterized membrane protein YkoI
MTSGRLISGCLILLLATLPATGPALAVPHHYPHMLIAKNGQNKNGQNKNAQNKNGGISLNQAIAKARQSNKDKVLSAETVQKDGRKIYRIKILTRDGRVKRTRIDARTGKKL